MGRLQIEIQEKKNNPILSPDRAINIDDIDNVDERSNALIFILEEDKGWAFEGKKAILKVRFCLAEEMKEKLNKYLKDGVVKSYAMNLWKVHRFEVDKNEATPEKEDEIKQQVVSLVEKSIKMIKNKAESSF